ncbi:Ig-like domain-containing protein, partial [Methylobacterium sp. Leaf117]|uniref:Ig-like domain-containing protein n=1 Tax=Methylobacterium sp. Leaf117 TaxID=1736260 RepID=UPI001FCCC990
MTIDTVAPGTPTITTAAGLTNDATPTIVGTAEAGSTVTISINGTVLDSVVAGPNGVFSFTPAANLAQGANSFTATARDLAGNVSASSTAVILTIDSVAPGVPVITTAAGLTTDATPTITGTAEAGATVTISDNGIVLGTAVAGPNGAFSFTPGADLGQGSNVLTVTARDLAGNISAPSAAVALTIDSVAPGAPVITTAAGLTTDATPTITGTAEAGATVTISDNGIVLGTAVAGPNGVFSFTPGADLVQGANSFTVTARDLAGNVSAASAAVALIIDSVAPGAPVITTAAGLTNDATPTITGTAEAGATVTISDNGTVLGTAVADTNGVFSFTPAADLAQGANSITVTARDLAGSISAPSAAVALTIDSLAPGAPVITTAAGLTNDATPPITGTAEAGSTVTISNNGTVIGTAVAGPNGVFSFTPAADLVQGPNLLTVTARDLAGNVSAPSAAVALTIDSLAPGAPVITTAAGLTNDATPTITGTAEAGATVTISDNGIVLGTAVAGPNGLFSFTPAADLVQGPNLLTVTARDLAGNVSTPSAAVTLTVDSLAPGAPTITTAPGLTPDATPTITGTAEAGATVTISDNGIVLGTAVADTNGVFSFTPAADLVQGSNVLTVTARDLAGNVSVPSAAVALTIDSLAPGAPVITIAPGLTNDATPTITGTAEAGATVTISNNGTVLGTAVAGPNGIFSFTPAADLAQGVNTVTVTARDLAGNVSAASAAVALTIDSLTPGVPVITTAAGLTPDATPTITGTAEAGSTVTLSDNGTVLGTAVADTNGLFSFTPAADLAQGVNTVTVTARDLAGNVSAPSAAVALTIDSVAPGAPTITAFAGTIADATPTITGTAEAGATVTVRSDALVLGTVIAAADGSFSLTPTVPLPNGPANLTATAQDGAGNLSAPSVVTPVVIDTRVPGAPLVDYVAPTNDDTPVITGTALAGDLITITSNGSAVGVGTAGPGGLFSVTLTVPLADGTNALEVTATPLGGSASPAAPVTVLVDTVAPLAPSITAFAGPTNDTTPTITGTAEAGATVTILDNGILIGTAVAGMNGGFSFTPTIPLTAGSNVLTATAQDLVGNVSPASVAVALTIDSVAPDAPTLTTAPGLTNDATPTITGTAEVGSTVTISDNGIVLGTALADTNGAFSFTPATDLAQGANSFTVTARDLAGNVSAASAAVALTIDSLAPDAPVITTVAGLTNDATPTITGTAEAGSTVTISDNGIVLGTTVADTNGVFSFTPATDLAQGANSVTVTAQDLAGNVSAPSSAVALTIDSVAPGAPVITTPAGLINDATPTITGTAEAGSTVTISDNGILLGTALAGANGVFSFTPTTPLTEGSNLLTATARGPAGNVSTPSAAVALTIDSLAPDAPVITSAAGLTNDATPTITGTAEAGSTVTISGNGLVLGTAVADTSGAFNFTPAANLVQGANSVTVTAQDLAGNVSAPSAAVALTIDSLAPAAPTLTIAPGLTNDATPTITGTAEAGSAVIISDNGIVLGTTVADTNGVFSFTPAADLAQGASSITVTAQDLAGNVSAPSTAVALTIDSVAPGAPVITTAAGLTTDATPTITGTAEAGSTVTLSDNGTVLGTATAGANGVFSYTPVADLAQGTNSITVTARDLAGNVSAPSAAVALTIDSVAPNAPSITAFVAPTNDTTPTITGTAEPGATVIVSNGTTQIGSTVAAADGSFSLTPAALPEGTASLTAVAVDAAGNASPASAATPLVIDLTPPGAPVFDALAPTTDTTPTITGTAEAGTTVTISDNGTVLGT